LAQSGHPDALNQCPLLGVKRTLIGTELPGFYLRGSDWASVAALAGLAASSCFLIKSVKLR
jgi:hypothetical protein